MPKYEVDLKPVAGHAIPPLLEKFAAWLSSQEDGSVGWFSLHAEAVPVEWDPDRIPRIQRGAFSFLELPDGSLLLLVNTGKGSPPAVGLLGSEGETDSVATSLEEFLILLSNAETGVSDLDEEEASGRKKLKAWLTKNKIEPPVRQRKERGSKLVEAALPRGLWDIHLKDLPDFRNFAYGWVNNIGGMFIRDDLVTVFGSREGPYGHAEAVLDDDDWKAVDKAAPVLDRRFAEWNPGASS